MSDTDTQDDDTSVTIELDNPITVGAETIAEIKLRQITGKDMRLMPVDEARPGQSTMWLVGRLSGLKQSATDKIAGGDLKRIADTVNGFLAGTPETGE